MLSNALILAGGYAGFRALIQGSKLPSYYNDSFEEICKSSGYTTESYTVTTDDGYNLKLFRIKHKSNESRGEPVLLVHGLTQSALSFIINKSALAPAFRLASSGHDVWLLNCRGSRYSLSHKYLSPESRSFWYWTAYDISTKDLPSSINFILSSTQRPSLNYIGYSQGGHVLLNLLSFDPSFNSKIKLGSLLAPVTGTILGEAPYFSRLISERQIEMFDFKKKYSSGQHVPGGSFHAKLAFEFPKVIKYLYTDRFNPEYTGDSFEHFPYYLTQLAGGTSVMNLRYYKQLKELNMPKPIAYDYGDRCGNFNKYQSEGPPYADYGKITAKLALFYGRFDKIVSPNDGRIFLEQVGKDVVIYKDFDRKIDHGGFILSKDLGHFDQISAMINSR